MRLETKHSPLDVESTRWWNLTLWHMMWLRFQTTLCVGSWQATWDFLLNLDNISNLHSLTWKIVWECKNYSPFADRVDQTPDCLCVVAEGRWQIGLKMCVYSVLTESDSTFTDWNTTYLCHSNWQSSLFVYFVYCYPCSVLPLTLLHSPLFCSVTEVCRQVCDNSSTISRRTEAGDQWPTDLVSCILNSASF